MKRDGANTSIWQANFDNYSANPYEQKKIYDVVIVGGGISGVSIAQLLQKNGQSCFLAEAQFLGFGTTSGTTAHLNTLLDLSYKELENKYGEENAKLILKATRGAIRFLESNVNEYNIDCNFKKRDGFLFSQNDDQTKELERIFEASIKAGCDVSYSENIPIPVPFEKALCYKDQGQIHPIKYLFSLAKEYEKSGGHIQQQCRVSNVKNLDDGLIEIETSIGKVVSRNIVYATHIPPGVNVLHFKCAPYRTYAMAFTVNDLQYPESLVYDMFDPYHYYRSHEINGQKVIIAGGNDHKTGEEKNTESCFISLEAYLKKYFKIKEVLFKWSSQFFEPIDGLPYIGHLPGNPSNYYVATGYGGNGITFSQVATQLLSDIITGKQNEFEKLFTPSRIKPVAGFTNFIKDAADVISHLATAPFSGEEIKEAAEIAKGEARIVNFKNKKLAIYKDETGKIYPLNAACTHIKCDVTFNYTEKVWECPCHGSRFSISGEMITAPARKDLEIISLFKEENK